MSVAAAPISSRLNGAGTTWLMTVVRAIQATAVTASTRQEQGRHAGAGAMAANVGSFQRASHHAISRPIQLTGWPMAANTHGG